MNEDDDKLTEKDIEEWVQWIKDFLNNKQIVASRDERGLKDNYWDLLT